MKGRRISAALCVLAFCLLFASPAVATKYVALGDSYSSGTGTRTFYESTCQRSIYAYAYLLHNAHPEWTFVNATCSGAKTGDILNTQVNGVTSDTNWVTYTIGGNDAGFSSVITECAQPSWLSNCEGAINTAPRLPAPVQRHRLQRLHLVQPDGGSAEERARRQPERGRTSSSAT
jgi:hypothetical protein